MCVVASQVGEFENVLKISLENILERSPALMYWLKRFGRFVHLL